MRGRKRREYLRLYKYEKLVDSWPKRHLRKFIHRKEKRNNLTNHTVRLRHVLSLSEDNDTAVEESSININIYQENCIRPEYIVFTWILCLIALASSLKLYYIVKTALATIIVMVIARAFFDLSSHLYVIFDYLYLQVYSVLIFVVCKGMFTSFSYEEYE